jgi:Ferritin-like
MTIGDFSDRRPGKVKLLDDGIGAGAASRRVFLQTMAARGVLIPAACALWSSESDSAETYTDTTTPTNTTKPGGKRSTATARILRDFSDPYLELIRLLHEASEVEHSLMLQYLYGAFSLKPAYHAIAGYGAPSATDLIGVAIQEMQHLGAVNRMLVAFGAAPHLIREDFPYEPELYPFPFYLEPLSLESLAKYVYCEAPVGATDPHNAKTPDDVAFQKRLFKSLGVNRRPNHVGSLYNSIIAQVKEVSAASIPGLPEVKPWIEKLEDIRSQGEHDHYEFFRGLFMGTNDGFKGHPDVWALSPEHPDYPSVALIANPSAYVGHSNQIQDPVAFGLAWLGNLHYWTVLFLLDAGFRSDSLTYINLAKVNMLGPVWALARHMPQYGVGLPFDPLCSGYAPGTNQVGTLRITQRVLAEADSLTQKLQAHLPSDYPMTIARESIAQLTTEINEKVHANA